MPEYQALAAAREKSGDRASVSRSADAHLALMNAVGDERLKAAIAADYATVVSRLDEFDGGKHRRLVLDTLDWAVARTPHDDPQRARRLLARARAKAAVGARSGQILADYRAAARLALLARPVWRDVVMALARYEADLYSRETSYLALSSALVTCRDLAEAVRRDFGRTADVPLLRRLEQEVTEQLGAQMTRWLMICHRDPGVLERQRQLIGLLRKMPVSLDVLEQRRQQAWLLATGLPLYHQDRPAALLDLYFAHCDMWEIGGEPDAAALAHDTAAEALLTMSPDDPLRGRLLVAFSHSGMSLAKQTKDVDLAGAAVEAGRAAVGLPTGDPAERALRRSELASALITQYELGGDPAAAGRRSRSPRRPLLLPRLTTRISRCAGPCCAPPPRRPPRQANPACSPRRSRRAGRRRRPFRWATHAVR